MTIRVLNHCWYDLEDNNQGKKCHTYAGFRGEGGPFPFHYQGGGGGPPGSAHVLIKLIPHGIHM